MSTYFRCFGCGHAWWPQPGQPVTPCPRCQSRDVRTFEQAAPAQQSPAHPEPVSQGLGQGIGLAFGLVLTLVFFGLVAVGLVVLACAGIWRVLIG